MEKYIRILKNEFPFFLKDDLLKVKIGQMPDSLEFEFGDEIYPIGFSEEGKLFEYIDKSTYDRRLAKPEE